VESLYCFHSAKKLKLNLNSHWVVIFVLILAKLLISVKPLSELVTHCMVRRSASQLSLVLISWAARHVKLC